jgi:hypothetical protein
MWDFEFVSMRFEGQGPLLTFERPLLCGRPDQLKIYTLSKEKENTFKKLKISRFYKMPNNGLTFICTQTKAL